MKELEELLEAENIKDSIPDISYFVAKLCQWGTHLEELTEQQKNFYFNRCLEIEVNNGGFWQYFINSSGRYAHQTVETLKLIGADNFAKILREAIDEFPNKTVPQDDEERQEIVDKNYGAWNKLDYKFYEYPDDLNQLNADYIMQNKEFFR